MKVILAEKLSVGREIACLIGATTSREGIWKAMVMPLRGLLVIWCNWHCLKLMAVKDFIESNC